MDNFNENPEGSTNQEILAMFSAFKENRIRLYENMIKDIDEYAEWEIPVERL